MYGEQQVYSSLTDEWAWSDAHALPGAVDVAIIGGGIVGCSAAYFLVREGLRVAVFEKGRIAGEQSGRNWGWVRQQGLAQDDAQLAELEEWLSVAREHSLDTRLLDAHQLAAVLRTDDRRDVSMTSRKAPPPPHPCPGDAAPRRI